MVTVGGRTSCVPVLAVSMVMELIATKVIVCVAMVDCQCVAPMEHERQARQLLHARPGRRSQESAQISPATDPCGPLGMPEYPV